MAEDQTSYVHIYTIVFLTLLFTFGRMMPFLILSGQLCPPGIEGTLFALFMSINNLSSTLGSFLGAALTSALNISSVQFDNLALGLAVQLMGTLLPIGFLFLIPRDVTGLTSGYRPDHHFFWTGLVCIP
uniref:Major facilitator superfamily (MFS) profile domain-containing protein n=1 Tax=Aegilops tauschii subsp. strangulata TaxID=200361 RepID=A0A453EL08_AEGTS